MKKFKRVLTKFFAIKEQLESFIDSIKESEDSFIQIFVLDRSKGSVYIFSPHNWDIMNIPIIVKKLLGEYSSINMCGEYIDNKELGYGDTADEAIIDYYKKNMEDIK